MAQLANPTGMPDLQLRMSKKIAQLTKVIYHLNSKTEDHEQEMQEMSEQYESEIEQILKDTTEKINFFKAQMEDARDPRHLHEVAKRLEIKYEDEKRRCLTELEALKRKAADREAALQTAANRQVEGLVQQVADMQRQLQAKVREVTELSKMATSSSKELSDALSKARTETEEAIQAGNKKYNLMLAERMRTEDELTEKLKATEAALSQEQTARQQLEATLKEERERLDGQVQTLQSNMKASEQQWQERLTSQQEEQAAERAAAREAAQVAAENARRSADQIQTLQAQLSARDIELANSKEDIDRLLVQLQEMTASNEQQMSSLNNQLAKEQQRVAELEAALTTEKQAHLAAAETARLKYQELQENLNSMANSCKMAQSLADRTQKALDATQAELDATSAKLLALQKASESKESELLKQIKSLMSDIEGLQEAVRQAVAAGQTDAASAVTALRKEMADKLAAAAAEHKGELLEAARESAAALAAAQAETALQLTKQKEEAAVQPQELQARLEQQHADALAGLLGSHNVQAQGAAQQLQQLQQQLHEATTALQAKCDELEMLKSDMEAAQKVAHLKIQGLEESEASLSRELAGLRSSLAGSQQDITAREQQLAALQQQVADLRRQLEVDAKSAADQQAAALLALEQEWSNRAARQVQEAQDRSDAAARASLASLQSQLTAAQHEALGGAEAAAAQRLTTAQQQWDQDTQRLKQQHEEAMTKAAQEAELLLQTLQQQAAKQLADALAAADNRHAAAEHAWRQQAADELQRLKEQHATSLQALKDQQAAQLSELQQQLTSQLQSSSQQSADALALATAKAAADIEEANRKAAVELSRLKSLHEETVVKLKKEHDREVERLKSSAEAEAAAAYEQRKSHEKQLETLQKQKTALELDKSTLSSRVEELQEALMRKSAEMADTVASLKQSWAEERQQSLASYQNDKQRLAEGHVAEMAAAQQQAAGLLAAAEERFNALQQEYDTLKGRWEAREPRPEDVELIAALQAHVRELEELVRTSEERMAHLRAELLLREENYNKHFRNGGVGEKVLSVGQAMNAQADVMDWMLKKKDSGARKTSGRL